MRNWTPRKRDPRPNGDRECYWCGVNRAKRGLNGYCSGACRFRAGYKVDEQSGCWLWQRGAHNRKGYGRIRVGGVKFMVHRFAYEAMVGPVPDGMQLDHLCRNTRCVNPGHLEPVTPGENVRRERKVRVARSLGLASTRRLPEGE